MAEFNLQDVFNKAFGYQPPDNFKIDAQAPAKAVNGSLGSPYYANDLLGREMFMPVTFYPGATLFGAIELLIPFAVVSISCRKIIVSTPMPERGGSVKELITVDDYAINIKGIVVNDDNGFPEEQVKGLQAIFQLKYSMTMRSVLTDIFLNGAYNQRVVIKEMKWPAVAGVENARPFEMDCESDSIFDLIQQ